MPALDSVQRQAWPDVEHIVVDGGSTDGTVELVVNRPELGFIPGPDNGIYDALNKGLAAVSGDVVGFLNSDDYYEAGAFAAVAQAFSAAPDCDAVCGSARLVCDGGTVAVYDYEEDKRLTSARTALLGASIINARFFRKAALEKIGPFSTAYRIVSDRDFLTRAITLGLRTKPIQLLVYTYRRHHASLSFSGNTAQLPAIWHELLPLARSWSEAKNASPETKRIARSLEGRCLGRLVQTELRAGRLKSAWQLISQGDRRLLGNLAAVGHGLIDATAARIAVPMDIAVEQPTRSRQQAED